MSRLFKCHDHVANTRINRACQGKKEISKRETGGTFCCNGGAAVEETPNSETGSSWCRRSESNRHGRKARRILSPLRLPVSPLRHNPEESGAVRCMYTRKFSKIVRKGLSAVNQNFARFGRKQWKSVDIYGASRYNFLIVYKQSRRLAAVRNRSAEGSFCRAYGP